MPETKREIVAKIPDQLRVLIDRLNELAGLAPASAEEIQQCRRLIEDQAEAFDAIEDPMSIADETIYAAADRIARISARAIRAAEQARTNPTVTVSFDLES
jgi:hypothetical protein